MGAWCGGNRPATRSVRSSRACAGGDAVTTAEWMLLAAVLITLLTIAPFKPLGWRTFDNAKPRDPTFWAEPLRARAQGAHINGIETFPFFAAAVLLAEFRAAPQHWIDWLAVGF